MNTAWSQVAFPDVTLANVSRQLHFGRAESAPVNAIEVVDNDLQPTLCVSRDTIASMAAKHAVLARLLRKHARSHIADSQPAPCADRPCADRPRPNQLLATIESYQADREAQKAVEQALLAHYSILGLEQALPIQKEMVRVTVLALSEQSIAIENQLPVSNPTQLSILRLQTLDKLELSQQTMRNLRTSLSQLIPSEVACGYHPCLETQVRQPANLCDEIQNGVQTRCDLKALDLWIEQSTVEHLEISRSLLGSVVGLPQLGSAIPKRTWKSILGLDRKQKEQALCAVKDQLREAKCFLEGKISNEIELAWNEWSSTTQRVHYAEELASLRKLRFEQLAAMAELGRPMAAECYQSKLEWLAAQLEVIQRQTEQAMAGVRLDSAIGQLPSR